MARSRWSATRSTGQCGATRSSPRRTYTLAEASALIEPLGALIAELREARAVMADRERAARLGAVAGGNGGGADGTVFAKAALVFTRGLAQIDRWGVIVRDLDTGICDFPALREGREVYLCWRAGEARIEWWHETDAGFAGRLPLDDRIT